MFVALRCGILYSLCKMIVASIATVNELSGKLKKCIFLHENL